MKTMGSMGSSRDIIVKWGGEHDKVIFFDGDGGDKVNNININGLTQVQWLEEQKRLDDINIQFNLKRSDSSNEENNSENCQ